MKQTPAPANRIGALLGMIVLLAGASVPAQTWTSVDGGGSTGINNSTATWSRYASTAVFNGALYAAWQEQTPTAGQVHIKKYASGIWSPAGNTVGQSKLNASNTDAGAPKIITYNGALYATWEENDEYGGVRTIHAKKYDGTNWTFVQNYSAGDGRVNINHLPAAYANNGALVVFNNELYAAWSEQANGHPEYQIRVSKFNGSLWTSVDGNGFYGLNYNTGADVYGTSMSFAVYNNHLYLSWKEQNSSKNSTLVRVRRYDGGSTWTFVDGNTANGMNYDPAKQARTPLLCSYNNMLYALWSELYLNPLYGDIELLRVKRYDGTNWTFADGGGITGWNKDIYLNVGATNPTALVYDNVMYVAWYEVDTVNYVDQIRTVKYNGTAKTFIDGGGLTGINFNTARNAENPVLTDYNGELYALWHEGKTNGLTDDQIRAKKYPVPGVITSVTVPANGTYKAGDYLNFTVNFNKAVTVSGGTPYLPVTLNTGGTVSAAYVSGSGTSSLLFRYTIAANTADNDGISVGSSIGLPGGCAMRDANSIDADLTLNDVGVTTGILVDAVAPSVSSINRQSPTNATTNATGLVFRVTFSKNVGGVDASDFSLTATGTAAGTVASVSAGSGTTIDVAVNGVSGDGTLRLDLKNSGTGISDAAGNPIGGGFTSGETYTLDHTAPSAVSINRQNPAAATTSASSVTYRVAFGENVDNVATGAFTLTETGTATGTVMSVSSGTGSTIDVTVGSIDGYGTLRLDLKSSETGITDDAGNGIAGGFTAGQTYTIAQPPAVTTEAATAIGAATATGNGTLTNLGLPNPTSHGVCWSTNANPTTADNAADKGTASATGAFTAAITGLSPNTTYHVRAYATNLYGTVYGADVSFATQARQFTLTANATNGTVGKNPDSPAYDSSTVVQLTAVPAAGYSFTNWSGDLTGSANPANATINGNKTITANFTLNAYALTVTSANGTVTRDPDQASYSHGSTVQLTATPAEGYHFSSWSGDLTGTANPASMTMDGNKSITANFAINAYSLSINAANGTVTKDPDQALYNHGSTVQLTATPAAGHHFYNWSGDLSGTSNPASMAMDGNKTVTANFALNAYTLTVASGAGGAITAPPSSPVTVNYGAATPITATPAAGYTFARWMRSNTAASITDSTSVSTTVTLTDSATVTALFSLNAASAPALVAPANAMKTTVDSVFFVWDKAAPAIDGYALTVSTDSEMTAIVVSDTLPADTSAMVRHLAQGHTYWWRVRAHNAAGWGDAGAKRSFTIDIPTAVLPTKYSMHMTGLARSSSSIRYALPKATAVSIRLFNVQGRIARTIYTGYQAAGYYQIPFDIALLSRGCYLLEFRAGEYAAKTRVIKQ
jgi:hypothetical protein